MSERRRATSLGPAETILLRGWAETLWHAFDAMPYLVGSVARSEAWRDVDVRCILPDDDPLLAKSKLRVDALSAAVSFWGQRATGLPIDFQFQAQSEANQHDGERYALAVLTAVYPRAPK